MATLIGKPTPSMALATGSNPASWTSTECVPAARAISSTRKRADDPKRLQAYRSQYEAKQRATQRQAKKARSKKAEAKTKPSEAPSAENDG